MSKKPKKKPPKNSLESLERKLKLLNKEIKRVSKGKKAPPEFLENEIKRLINIKTIQSLVFEPWEEIKFYKGYPGIFVEELEEEYLCYFQRNRFEKIIRSRKKDDTRNRWGFIYAGINGQIEGFLERNGFKQALKKLGLEKPFKPVKEIAKKELPEIIRRYFISTGYLYPKEDKVIVHPNVLRAQIFEHRYEQDTPFLTRDLVRCSHRVALRCDEESLSDQELWRYWSNLVALALGKSKYEYISAEDSRKGTAERRIKPYLEFGRKLVPQRYIELEPRIEEFNWVLPKTKKLLKYFSLI